MTPLGDRSATRTHRIGEAARLVGVSPSALRLWERQGLVRPMRSRRRYRLYSAADLDRLRRIHAMRMLDRVNAPGIRRILDDAPQHTDGGPVRVGDRGVTNVGDGVRIERLARNATMLEPQLFVLAPGARSEGVYAHDGEEFLFVLQGRLVIWVDGEPMELGPGDAHTFASTLPHRWRNEASGETRLLWINTPPTF